MITKSSKQHKNKCIVHRGEIFYADLGTGVGSEQQGVRPVLIVQNEDGNKYGPTTIIVPLTKHVKNNWLPVHILVEKEISGLEYDSVLMFEQLRVIDKKRLKEKVSTLTDTTLIANINKKLKISLSIY